MDFILTASRSSVINRHSRVKPIRGRSSAGPEQRCSAALFIGRESLLKRRRDMTQFKTAPQCCGARRKDLGTALQSDGFWMSGRWHFYADRARPAFGQSALPLLQTILSLFRSLVRAFQCPRRERFFLPRRAFREGGGGDTESRRKNDIARHSKSSLERRGWIFAHPIALIRHLPGVPLLSFLLYFSENHAVNHSASAALRE